MRDNGKAIRQFDVAYFTASCDTVDTNTKFAKKLELDYPILSDPEREVAAKYGLVSGIRRFPARKTFVIGKDGKILHIFERVKAAQHGKELIQKLKELKVDMAKKEPAKKKTTKAKG